MFLLALDPADASSIHFSLLSQPKMSPNHAFLEPMSPEEIAVTKNICTCSLMDTTGVEFLSVKDVCSVEQWALLE